MIGGGSMKFGKALTAVIAVAVLASSLLVVSADTTVTGASVEGYGSSDSMSVEYREGSGKGLATITLKEAPGAGKVEVCIGTYTVNPPASDVIEIFTEDPLATGTYPVMVTVAGKLVAECSLVIDTYYTIDATAGTGGKASASTVKTLSGTTVTLTASPYAGYMLKGWESSDVTVTDNSFTMPAKDVSVKAVFEKSPSYPVTVPADGQVAKADIDKAIESVRECKEAGTEQDITISGKGDSVSLPADSVKTLLDLGSDVTVDLPSGSVTVAKDSVSGLQAGDSLEVTIESVKAPSGFTLSDGAVVIDVSVSLGDKGVTSFGSPITVSIPYKLSAGQNPSELKVYCLSDDGKVKDMNATYDAEAGAMVFTTDHLSVYAVATSADAVGSNGDANTTVYYAVAIVVLAAAIGAVVYMVKRK